MGNLSLLIAHRQVVPALGRADRRLAGTRGSWRVSWGSRRGTTRTRASEPVLDAETLMALPPGCAAVIGFGAGRDVSLMKVRPAGGGH